MFSSLFLSIVFPFDFSVLSFSCCNFTVLHCCPICLHFASSFFRFSCLHSFTCFVYSLFFCCLLCIFLFLSTSSLFACMLRFLNFYFVFFILASLYLVMSIMFWFLILFYFLHYHGRIFVQAVLDRMRDPYGLLGMLALLPLLEALDALICFAQA